MERKFTRGPWLYEGKTVYALNEDGYNRFSALVQDAHTGEEELLANARLIAAAPELLRLVEMANTPVYGTHTKYWQDRASAAIAKATGEQE